MKLRLFFKTPSENIAVISVIRPSSASGDLSDSNICRHINNPDQFLYLLFRLPRSNCATLIYISITSLSGPAAPETDFLWSGAKERRTRPRVTGRQAGRRVVMEM